MVTDYDRGGASAKLQYFLIISTCLLYLVAAGLFSRGVWYLQAQAWNKVVGSDADEVGSGPGSYDISNSVWHVNVGSLFVLHILSDDPLWLFSR
jgi:high-affinity iron transporter